MKKRSGKMTCILMMLAMVIGLLCFNVNTANAATAQITVSLSDQDNITKGDMVSVLPNVSGGDGDYTFAWYVDGEYSGSTTDKTESFRFRSGLAGNHSIRVVVTDGSGLTGEATCTMTVQPNVNGYVVHCTEAKNGTVTAEPDSGLREGDTVKLTADPDEGYEFKNWVVSYGNVVISDDDTLVMPASDVGISAVFELKKYSVKVTTDGHGKASSDVELGVPGTDVTLSAEPESGYKFKEWQVVSGGVTVSGDKFTLGDKNVEVKAVFEQIMHTVKFSANGGSGSKDAESVAEGTSYTLPENPYTPPMGMKFKAWDMAGTMYQPGDKITVNANITFVAQWEEHKTVYTVTEGADGSWTKGSTDGYTIVVKSDEEVDESFEHLKGVQAGERVLVEGTDYDAVKGSTVITLKPSLLEDLSVDTHTIMVLFDDNGTAETKLTIKEAEKSGSKTDNNTDNKTVEKKTGDSFNIILWISVMAVSMVGIVALIVFKRKKKM